MASRCGNCGLCQRCTYLARRPTTTQPARRSAPTHPTSRPPRRKDPRRIGLRVFVPEPMRHAIIAARRDDHATWATIVARSGTTEWVCRRIVADA